MPSTSYSHHPSLATPSTSYSSPYAPPPPPLLTSSSPSLPPISAPLPPTPSFLHHHQQQRPIASVRPMYANGSLEHQQQQPQPSLGPGRMGLPNVPPPPSAAGIRNEANGSQEQPQASSSARKFPVEELKKQVRSTVMVNSPLRVFAGSLKPCFCRAWPFRTWSFPGTW